MEKAVDFTIICRMCLAQSDKFIDIFDNEENCSLSLRIMACVALEVKSTDALPKQICSECRYLLEKFYYFRKKSKNSDTKLRRHLRLINSGKVSDFFNSSDEDLDEDEYAESLTFFKKWEEDDNIKKEAEQQQRNVQFQEELQKEKEKIYEETKRIIEEKVYAESILKEKYQNVIIHETFEEPENSSKNDVELSMIEIDDEPYDESVDETILENDSLVAEYDNTVLDNMSVIEANENQSNFIVNGSDEDDLSFELNTQTPEENDFMMSSSSFKDEAGIDIEYLDESNHETIISEYQELSDEIKESIASSTGLNLTGDVKYKIRKHPRKTHIEVRTYEGNVVCIEFEEDEEKTVKKDTKTSTADENGEIKIFECDKCPKRFPRRIQLNRHASIHEKRQGFNCSFCEKWFPSNSALERHIRIHTGEKPFHCEQCGRSFIQKEILKRHIMTHTGERPFKCPYCSRTFTQKENLRLHIYKQHTENPVPIYHECFFVVVISSCIRT